MPARLTVAVLLFAISVAPLSAQRPEQLRVGIQGARVTDLQLNPAVVPRADSTYWKTGFIFGSIVGSLFIASVAGGFGADLDLRFVVVSAMGGMLIGGVPGALIGGLFPKH